MTDELMALLACPFCGDQCAELMVTQGDKWAGYVPGCLETRTGYDVTECASWRSEAIAAWNCRTERPALIAERDTLREALRPFKRVADMTDHEQSGASVSVNVNLCRAARAALGASHDAK